MKRTRIILSLAFFVNLLMLSCVKEYGIKPYVETKEVTNIGDNTASCGGKVLQKGDAEVLECGVCWNTSHRPTIKNSHTIDDLTGGEFSSQLQGLSADTKYYVRAYATSRGGTAYGAEVSFTTTSTSIELDSKPTVTTSIVNVISISSACTGGNVTQGGSTPVTARGVCWSTSHNPTISNSHTTNGSGTGSFSSSLTGLSEGTTYYVRAYATNSAGTAYGNEVSFTTTTETISKPTVTTFTVSNISTNSASTGGNVTQSGSTPVTARGCCWSTNHNPTISNSYTTNGSGMGSFSSSLTGLSEGTTYYVRAYATNSAGTAYGEEKIFTTVNGSNEQYGIPCPGTPTLTDIDGNTYNTVQIGQQCWMKENLRTTKYANGTTISHGSSTSSVTAYWYYPNNSSSSMSTYGLLYNWKAVMGSSSSSSAYPSGVQGICPTGWHVPSDAEWTQLTDYVSSQNQYVCGSTNTQIAKALAGTTGWDSSTETCAVGNMTADNNATGFSALPAGYYGGSYYFFGNRAYFWSATEYSSASAYNRPLYYNNAVVCRSTQSKNFGFSVRCVKD